MAEPTYDPTGAGNLQFRDRRPAPSRDAPPLGGLWWQVALGVFLALMAHSLITGLWERYEAQRIMRQVNEETRKASVQLQQAIKALEALPPTSDTHVTQPLHPGERCVSGRRFMRLGNGWRQLPEPCR